MIFEKQIINAYKSMMYTRCDDTETVFYFSASDFPGLLLESNHAGTLISDFQPPKV